MLIEGLLAQNFEVVQAVENADSTIISKVFQLGWQSGTSVIFFGKDVDLLILLTAAAPVSSKTYLLKPGKGKQANMFYSPLGFKYPDKVKKNVFIFTCFSGCNSTLTMFREGKLKFVKTPEKYIHLQEAVTIFSKTDATQNEVGRTGQQFIAALYSGCKDDKLVTNCAPIDDESEAILAIQKGGEVVEEEEADEKVSCKPPLKNIKPNQTCLKKHVMEFSFVK
ncbi:hypothetical protein ILUMI_27388 [Ignelater luminosus]|uniref:Uncharacterized protein n=1 Tax=Ignelater luminosus TaxID=2038154 RepID=A0A8K0FY81_IGNLU|nr:hypothetical protein ILUMI_27388 [Ignelater luminosus]